jgi:hypothetical protein
MKTNHSGTAQRNKLLERLRQKPVTTFEAIEELDIMRPAPRIFELKERGHNIITQRITQNGHNNVARYVLLAEVKDEPR